jgi:2'-5' RNA ligase
MRLESVERVALTASGNAAEWANRVVNNEYGTLTRALAACGCGGESDDRQYFGILDPEYPEPLVIAVVSIDGEGSLRRWNEQQWEDVPTELEPEGYPFVALEGGMLVDALRASGGMLLRPTTPKGKVSGALVSAGSVPGGKHFALVDDFDTSAVLDLIEMRPGPRAYVRHGGEWVLDGGVLGRLQSVDPPKVVQIDEDQLETVLKQVDEFDRAHADKEETVAASGLVAARLMDDRYETPVRKVAPRPAAKKKPAPKSTSRPTRARSRASGSSSGRSWDEEKYNRVDGKFAAKGASDNHNNDRGRRRGRAVGSNAKRKRVRVSQATVDELNRHSMAENIAKANSGKASPEFVEAARRFYPGRIKDSVGDGTTGKKKGSSTSARAKAKRAARKGKTPAQRTAQQKLADELARKEKAERVNNAKWEVRRAKADLGEQRRRGEFNDKMRSFYTSFDPTKTDDKEMAKMNALFQQEQRRREAYDRAAEYEAQAEAIRRLERRIKLGLIAAVGVRPVIAAPVEHSMMPDKLKSYWARGVGAAKIRWGTGGDFNRCRRQLAKYLRPDQVAGACANLHKAATGTWPGKGRKHGVTAAAYEGNGAMVAFTYAPEVAERLAANVNDGNPAHEMHVTLAYLGEDVDPEVVEVAAQIAEAMTLEYNKLPAYLGGRGQFMNEETANYVSVDAPGIEGFWADLTERLGRAGVPLPTEHGFTAHTTLKYGEMDESEWPTLPLRTELGTIVVRHGGNTVGQWELLP